jgi:5-(hydroxymethyl)furfural/furfural oxidase
VTTYLPKQLMQPPDNAWLLQNWLRFSSNHPGGAQNDMHLMPFSRCAWHELGRHIGALVVSVFKPYSKGCVRLRNADPTVNPTVCFNLLTDSRDYDRLVSGVRLAFELLDDPIVRRDRGEVFVPDDDIFVRLNRRSWRNGAVAQALAFVLRQKFARNRLLAKRRLEPRNYLADENALREFVSREVQPQYHVCGTCRMGSSADPDAVCDPAARVRGLEGLRVVDASIFPTIPRANTHLSVIMVAEKVADVVKAEWRTEGG